MRFELYEDMAFILDNHYFTMREENSRLIRAFILVLDDAILF